MRELREPWNHLDQISRIRVRQRAFRQSTQSPRNLHTTPASPYSPTASGLTHNLNTISTQSPHNLHTQSPHTISTHPRHTPPPPHCPTASEVTQTHLHSLTTHTHTHATLADRRRQPPSPTPVPTPVADRRRQTLRLRWRFSPSRESSG